MYLPRTWSDEGALGECSNTVREIDSNMQQVKQRYKISAIVVGGDAAASGTVSWSGHDGESWQWSCTLELGEEVRALLRVLVGWMTRSTIARSLSSQRVADHCPEATIIAVLEAKEGWLCMNRSPFLRLDFSFFE